MPTYDYKCQSCEHSFEKIHKISEMDDSHPCPECESTDTKRFLAGSPSMGDPVRLGLVKPSDGFRDRLREIDKRTPGSTLKNNSSYI